METNLLSGDQVLMHGDDGVLPIDRDHVRDGVVAGLRDGVVAHGGGELIEVAVEEDEDVNGTVVDGDDLGGEGLLEVLCGL